MSAEAAKAAFAVIKDSMAGKPREMKGKIIIATVKGDIHDIGKNIVKVMLENYGYDVIDLGKDVPPELIVDNARCKISRTQCFNDNNSSEYGRYYKTIEGKEA